jgi:hypothetical protein
MATSGTTLYKQRIYCITQASWEYVWTETTTPITTCPVNTTHTVQDGSQGIIAVQAPSTVVVNKEPTVTTSGIGRVDSLSIPVAANSTGSLTQTWPYDIAVYSMTAGVTASAVGCSLTLNANPNAAAGTLTADAQIGATTLSVSPTVTANVVNGTIITLQNGSTTQNLGVVTAVDPTGGTITVSTPTSSLFPSGSAVLTTTCAANGMVFSLEGYVTFGEDRSIARPIPKGMPLQFIVNNPNNAPTTLVIYVSYNY